MARRFSRYVCLFSLIFAASSAWAAKQTQPPSWDLQDQSNHRLIIATPSEIDGAAVTFDVIQKLAGEPGEKSITLAFDDATVALIGGKGRYLLAYTDAEKKRFPAEGYHRTEPRVVRNLLAGEIISGSSPAAIEMLDGTAQRKFADSPSDHADFLLAQLQSGDPFLQRLSAAEILGRPSLMEQFNADQTSQVWDFAADVNRDPMARTMALRIGFASDGYTERARTVVRGLLDTTPVSVVRNDMYWPGLVYTALIALADQFSPGEKDLPAFARWMGAAHRGVVEAALRGIGKTQPERELTEIYRALAQPFLAAEARQVLQQRVQGVSKR
ncbi:MAG: hypothetical protein AAF552_03395 [Pseudomonadota bacterium]